MKGSGPPARGVLVIREGNVLRGPGPELLCTENPQLLARAGDPENERDGGARTLKITNPDAVGAVIEGKARFLALRGMNAVVIDDQSIVDVQERAVVGGKNKAIYGGMPNPELSAVIYCEPLEALRNTGETLSEIPGRDVKRAGVNSSPRLEMTETVRQDSGVRLQIVDDAAQAGGIHHGSAKRGGAKSGSRLQRCAKPRHRAQPHEE
jgi:hypothetical protein